MSKNKTVSTLATRVMQVAPDLKYVATYSADHPLLKASLRLYEHRAFVYILTVQLTYREACIYVGKSRAQYDRILRHKSMYAFDKLYLFECEPSALRQSERDVIRLLVPIFNKQNNPMYGRYETVLDIDYSDLCDREKVIQYLQRWDNYCSCGVYGFALPPVIYRILKQEAQAHNCTVSEQLTEILEKRFSNDISQTRDGDFKSEEKTNLITTAEYAVRHHKSQEQIKQYLKAGDRLNGVKLGRDWVIIGDEKLPEDRRKKTTVDQPMFC